MKCSVMRPSFNYKQHRIHSEIQGCSSRHLHATAKSFSPRKVVANTLDINMSICHSWSCTNSSITQKCLHFRRNPARLLHPVRNCFHPSGNATSVVYIPTGFPLSMPRAAQDGSCLFFMRQTFGCCISAQDQIYKVADRCCWYKAVKNCKPLVARECQSSRTCGSKHSTIIHLELQRFCWNTTQHILTQRVSVKSVAFTYTHVYKCQHFAQTQVHYPLCQKYNRFCQKTSK